MSIATICILVSTVATVLAWTLSLLSQSKPKAIIVQVVPPQPRRTTVITPSHLGDDERALLVRHAEQVRALGLDRDGWHPMAPPLISSLPDKWELDSLGTGWDIAPIREDEADEDPPCPAHLTNHPDEERDLEPLDPPAPRRRW